jgi:hypothetical protein
VYTTKLFDETHSRVEMCYGSSAHNCPEFLPLQFSFILKLVTECKIIFDKFFLELNSRLKPLDKTFEQG